MLDFASDTDESDSASGGAFSESGDSEDELDDRVPLLRRRPSRNVSCFYAESALVAALGCVVPAFLYSA